ncbi:hypothetical protein [Hyphobacterium sp.]|uniref:hypothetical protein n=1 Tax=Hyphobacterium sp. TaxID=2004662 RepID=UPI003BACA4D4
MLNFAKPVLLPLFAAAGLGLVACGGANTVETGGPQPADTMTLPVEYRVAFMSGHVEAGLALYRAGAPDQAAPHLLHPVSETHAAERDGIDALGFRAEVFEQVSEAQESGRPASEIEPLLDAAEANLALMRDNAGGDQRAILSYLMDVTEVEYAIGVTDGAVTDPGEYQDAYGFSVVALNIAHSLGNEALIAELEALTGLWPETGPRADSVPTPVDELNAQIVRVRATL